MAAVLRLLLLLLLLLGWLRGGGEAAVVARCADPDHTHFHRPCACGPEGSACVHKCCGLDEAMDASNKSCVPSDGPDLAGALLANLPGNFSVMAGAGLACPCGGYRLGDDDDAQLLPSGGFFIRDGDVTAVTHSFCVDALLHGERGAGAAELLALVCFAACDEERAPPPRAARVMDLVKYWGMLLSAPFLLATLLVYAAVPRLRNLHGKALMCHVSAMLVAYVLLAALGIAHVASGSVCVATGNALRLHTLLPAGVVVKNAITGLPLTQLSHT
ncbi:hypothetical protein R5R35_007150 [Gryllus longicercus]|uniref:Uncharacterized protein n=1 Tax=Gryllus longicercus TaxID=2509291 RepID=A0AAN9V3N7_9ORTH